MKIKRTLYLVISFILISLSMPLIVASGGELSHYLGFKKTPVQVVGTGSMYPSLYWEKSEGGPEDPSIKSLEEYRTDPLLYPRFPGINIKGHIYFKRTLGYGDIVAFKNVTTAKILETENKDVNSGFIKRIIAVGGDAIELRDGFVYRNGSLLSEPYVYKPRSTYGEASIPDCSKIIVPDGQLLVLGDNRKVSSDSRGELGLISDGDVSHVLPYTEQQQYQSLWRDTSKDAGLVGTPTFDTKVALSLINEYRSSHKIKPLVINTRLTKSSGIQATSVLDDKKKTFSQAMTEAGYGNIVTGAVVSRGFYTAEEWFQNLVAFNNTVIQIINSDYSEIGVSAVVKEIDGCPKQVIVSHFGGFIPPAYKAELVDSWKNLRDNISSVLPSWEDAVGNDQIDQKKLSELLNILYGRLSLATRIESKIREYQWLTKEDENDIQADTINAARASALVEELNKP